MLIEYIRSRTRFHAKTTVRVVTSKMRLMGEYLVAEGVWSKNPMRWIKGRDWILEANPRTLARSI